MKLDKWQLVGILILAVAFLTIFSCNNFTFRYRYPPKFHILEIYRGQLKKGKNIGPI